jgi:hypothetical protein
VTVPSAMASVTYLGIGSSTGFMICGANVDTFNVYNGDTANVVLISQAQTPQPSNSLPVQPLTNATIIGPGPWYASAAAGPIASMTVSPGSQLSPSPGQVAIQTSLQLQGILTSAPLYNVTNLPLPDEDAGGNPQFQNLTPITPVSLTGVGLVGTSIAFYSAYEVLARNLCAATAGAGACQVVLTWYNQLTDTVPLATVRWTVPANNPNAVNTVGNGPQRGNFLAVQVASLEALGTATTTLSKFSLTGSLRQAQNDNWQSDGVIFGGNVSSAKTFSNQLCIVNNAAVPGSGSIIRGCYLYAGRVKLFAENPGGTGTFVGTISQVAPPLGILWHGAIPQNGTGTSPTLADLIFDRTPMQVSVQATTAVAGNVNIAIIADRV